MSSRPFPGELGTVGSDERRLSTLFRTARVVFAGGPLAALIMSGAGSLSRLDLDEVVALGILTLGVVWGFLGSIAWVGARGIEAAEDAAEQRRLYRTAERDPWHGQLSLKPQGPGDDGSAGALSDVAS